MKLFWSSRSPFARKALMAAHEAGLASSIELVPISIPQRVPNPDLAGANPIGKLPTLVTDTGAVIVDSPVIAEYLDSLGNRTLFPAGQARWTAMSLQAMADEMLAILLLWRAELRRPEECRSAALLATYGERIGRGLDWCEARFAAEPAPPFTIGELTVGVLLSYLDFRFEELEWRSGHPALAGWHREFSARPSAIATDFAI